MKTSARGIALIKKYESCKLIAYPDPGSELYKTCRKNKISPYDNGYRKLAGWEKLNGGPWTIAWGHTKAVKPGDTCTQDRADKWLNEEDIIEFERIVNIWFKKVNQNQFDALVSLCYNIGPGNLKKSPIYVAVKTDPSDVRIRTYFMRHIYVKATNDKIDNDKDGVVDEPGEVDDLDGLVRRRTEEVTLYFKAA